MRMPPSPPSFVILLSLLVLAGCVSLPTGPSVLVLPGTGKSFDQFRLDDMDCRAYAYQSIGGTTTMDAARASGATIRSPA